MTTSEITLDRTLPDSETVRQELTFTGDLVHDEFDELRSIVRVLYPVFRVRYSYTEESSFPWNSDETHYDVCLVDGLWAGNSEELQSYVEETLDPTTVDPDERYADDDVRTSLLEFQLTDGQVSSVMKMQLSRTQSPASEDTAPPSTHDGNSAVGVPEASLAVFDSSSHSFATIDGIERLYLPFWMAKFTTETEDVPYYLSLRSVGEQAGSDRIDVHSWLATFTTNHPELVSECRRDDWLSSPERTTTASAVSTDREPTQPADSTLDVDDVFEADPRRSFDDVAGMGELKRRFRRRVIEPTRHPERFADYGLGTVDGVLLYGPPGCGKTYISGALADELGYAFLRVTPAVLTSKYAGEPAQKVADLFEIARLNQPCVVFIDEIDAIAGERSDERMNTSERQLVNQLLTELETVSDEDVIVVGATNRVEDVDSAIRRSGRFDERIEVLPPDVPARREILQLHLAGRPVASDLALDPIVEGTAGYAASDLEFLVETAARFALREDADIGTSHLQAALEDTETSIDEWTDAYPELFAEVEAHDTVVQPETVEMNAATVVDSAPQRAFPDVGGLDNLKTTLQRVVIDPVDNSEAYDEYELDTVDGVLLYGPPGCGKTYVAGALAGELGYRYLSMQPADVASKWMGQPAQNIADIFEIARANQPCLVFIDELDAVAGDRSGKMNTSEQQLVNQLLVELESLDGEVVVVAATNLLADVDRAIRRSGRFDERIEVPPPDEDARREVLAVHLDGRPSADDLDLSAVTDEMAGYAASDLALLVENASRRALRADEPISEEHLEAALSDTTSSLTNWEDRDRYEDDSETSSLRYIG